jgi:Domain of unknown function (DUF4352)/Protein of unknown function (DUF2510)/Domain of unknown function (DUF4190)
VRSETCDPAATDATSPVSLTHTSFYANILTFSMGSCAVSEGPTLPPPGWYPDPSGSPVQRYWDGTAWTAGEAPTATAPQRPPRNGFGVAALILGIIGVLTGIIPFFFWLAVILGIIGLILGFVGRGRAKRGEATNGTMALWGIITSAVAVVLSIVGLVILVGAFEELDEDLSGTETTVPSAAETSAPAQEDEPATEEPPAPEGAGFGDTVRDGQFEFTVTGIQPPVETVGEDFLAEEAQGQFIIVRVTVTNVGDEARTLDASSQYLYDADGRRYETSSALFTLEDADKVFLENINPGNTVTDAPLLYDVPDGFVPVSIELHDSPFSGGVTVTLS